MGTNYFLPGNCLNPSVPQSLLLTSQNHPRPLFLPHTPTACCPSSPHPCRPDNLELLLLLFPLPTAFPQMSPGMLIPKSSLEFDF